MVPMQGKFTSSQFHLGYTEIFCIPKVTLLFFSSCDSVVGDSLGQSSKSRLLICLIGKTQLLCMQGMGIGPHLAARWKSHGFSRVASGTGVYSPVTAGMSIRNWSFFQRIQDTCLRMTEKLGM